MKSPAALIPLVVVCAAIAGTLSASDTLTPEEQLGRALYLDPNLSLNRNQSCNSCHSIQPVVPTEQADFPAASGFVDPDNLRDGSPVSAGSISGTRGTLNTPSAAYASFSPHFHWDADEGLFVGGQFWNGRAASLAEQAEGPPLNPVEMAMPSRWAVVSRLKENPTYVEAFRAIYDISLDAIPANEGADASQQPPPGVLESYERMARAIGAFEKTRLFNRFDAKYDYVMAGVTEFTELEREGLELFNSDKSQCSACHPTTPLKAPGGRHLPPLFTDFTYDNLGIPSNMNISDDPPRDPGLGGRPEIAAMDPKGEEIGKHKVMGLRNIAVTPPYMHNGVLSTLEQVVHFYNTRDAKSRQCRNNLDPGFAGDCWPAPEFPGNVNSEELGNLGLSPRQEESLVAFMRTLTDGYPEWGQDPNVPPGTPSPFAEVVLPPSP